MATALCDEHEGTAIRASIAASELPGTTAEKFDACFAAGSLASTSGAAQILVTAAGSAADGDDAVVDAMAGGATGGAGAADSWAKPHSVAAKRMEIVFRIRTVYRLYAQRTAFTKMACQRTYAPHFADPALPFRPR